MACVSRCPAGAILRIPRSTDTGRCISCLACVKSCPAGARAVAGPAFPKMVEGLEGRLLSPAGNRSCITEGETMIKTVFRPLRHGGL